MRKTRFHPARAALAITATAGFCAGALVATSTPATASGDHDGDGYDVVIPLSQRTSNQLRDGANGIAAIGRADKWTDDGRVLLGFPVAGDHYRARHGDDAMALKGGIAYTGAGRDVTWTGLRVTDRGVITAVLSGGDRFKVLKVAGDRHRHARTGDYGGLTLVLTRAGAGSLNHAAAGTPFEAGDVFAGGNDCG
jgi:hypothetical protein